MTANEPIRLGILGGGRIVSRRILPALKTSPEVKLEMLASRRDGVAGSLADEFAIPQICHSYEELLASNDVDAVYVPCAGDEHHRWTLAAAKAGKHVLCEKPLAPSAHEAEEMVAACLENNVVLMEAFMWRHHPRALHAKELLDEGAIGNLRIITVNFSFNIDRSDWRLDPARGGGAMWDLGCYGVNASRFFTSEEPTDISAAAHWWSTGVDMSMRIGLTFPDEVLANIDCSFEAPFRCRLELVGDDGRMLIEPAFQPGDAPQIQLWRSAERDHPVEVIDCANDDQYACQLTHFAKSIRNGKLLAPAENGLLNMKTMEAILRDARS